MAAEELGLDDFLNHSTGRGGSAFADWREKGKLDFFLHTKSSIYAVYFHRWYRLDTGDESNPLSTYKSMRLNCIEDKRVLEKQRFRNRDGTREYPPTVCPHCLMIEWVAEQIRIGKLSWTAPIFRFGGEDDADSIEIHAGGITGKFGAKEMTKLEEKQLRAAGIRRDEAWKEKGLADMNYIFTIVDVEKPEEGAKIALEKQALGNKMKKAIADRREDLGADEGNPMKNPVAFRWKYHEDEIFEKKYEALVVSKIELTEEIERAITDDPPSLEKLTAEPDWAAYRTSLEHHALIDMPFDDFFAPLERKLGKSVVVTTGTSADDEPADDLPESWNKPSGKAAGAKGNAHEDDDDHMVACDECKKPMHEDLMECPHCGAEYEVVGGEIRLKPKKPTRSRTRG